MLNIADHNNIDVSEIFNVLTVYEVLQLIRERRFSPWILLTSNKFKKFVQSCIPEEQSLFEDLIRPAYWKVKFGKDPTSVTLMKQLVQELNI